MAELARVAVGAAEQLAVTDHSAAYTGGDRHPAEAAKLFSQAKFQFSYRAGIHIVLTHDSVDPQIAGQMLLYRHIVPSGVHRPDQDAFFAIHRAWQVHADAGDLPKGNPPVFEKSPKDFTALIKVLHAVRGISGKLQLLINLRKL